MERLKMRPRPPIREFLNLRGGGGEGHTQDPLGLAGTYNSYYESPFFVLTYHPFRFKISGCKKKKKKMDLAHFPFPRGKSAT